MASQRPQCREITDHDIDSIAALLARGFPGRSQPYWRHGLERQRTREVPAGYPRYGYVLESEGQPVGVLLLLFTATTFRDEVTIRCNVASWYVDPPFRGHAPRLVWAGLRHRDVTYINVTPAVSTWEVVEALGFKRYCKGLLFSLPLMSHIDRDARVEIVTPNSDTIADLADAERDLLLRHADYGCLSLVVRVPGEAPHPFILMPYRLRHGTIPLPAMQLIYCRNVEDYGRFAHAIGGVALSRGSPVIVLDSNGPMPGVVGWYTEMRGRKYFRGPNLPSLADLAETELPLYGP